MPVYLHDCLSCQARTENLLAIDAEPPVHCGRPMVRRMGAPFGRVVGSSAPITPRPVPSQAQLRPGRMWKTADGRGFERGRVVAEGGAPVAPSRQKRPEMPGPEMPTRVWPKAYEACDAAQRDERWRDSNEQMTAYRADCLTASGIERGEALKTASAAQQAATADARSQLGQG
jgi:hypothetical protein